MTDAYRDLFGDAPLASVRPQGQGMGGHHSTDAGTTTWLTPLGIIEQLGPFDLDPCAYPGWPTATNLICLPQDGLATDWGRKRAWVNPPYTSAEVMRWLRRLADHGRGTALIFARTETAAFVSQVWERATGLLFIAGRLTFHLPCGALADGNAGAPSVLCAYGQEDLDRLAASEIAGTVVPLRFPRFMLVQAAPSTWKDVVLSAVRERRGPASLSDIYRSLARHPKTRGRTHWQAKVRQVLQLGPFERVGPGTWVEAAA